MIVLEVIYWLIVVYLALPVLFLLNYALLSLIPYKRKRAKETPKQHRFAVLIPGYKEDAVIYEVAEEALNQDYPKDLYDVIIIADSFQPETLAKLRTLPIKVVEVSFDKSTKAKALNKTMSQLPDEYDVALILDADNVMATDVITKINEAYSLGYKIIQGHRAAKNLDSSFAILDAASEEINNNIFSNGHRNIGLSSRLVGSGMAFDYPMFKEIMSTIDAVGGFDKELELKLLKSGLKIEYVGDAMIYDEKVSKSEVFAKQRSRWISAQFYYFRKYFLSALAHLITKGNADYFDKAFQMIMPPRLMLLGGLFLGLVISTVLNFFVEPTMHFYIWLAMCVGGFLAFLLAIPRKFYNKNLLGAFMRLPKAFFTILFALFKIKGANKTFIHTPHTATKQNIEKDK